MYKVAISGLANTGKNTLSKMIVKQLRQQIETSQNRMLYSVKYLAFADPIKKMVQIMFPNLPKKFLYGSSKHRNEIIPGALKNGKPLTVRQLLCDLGTSVGRGYQDNIWLNNFDARFEEIKRCQMAIVTDIRFRNEFEHLKKNGFYQVRLYRETNEPKVDHVSETNQGEIKDYEFDYVIHNDMGLSDLKKEVRDNIIPHLKSK